MSPRNTEMTAQIANVFGIHLAHDVYDRKLGRVGDDDHQTAHLRSIRFDKDVGIFSVALTPHADHTAPAWGTKLGPHFVDVASLVFAARVEFEALDVDAFEAGHDLLHASFIRIPIR